MCSDAVSPTISVGDLAKCYQIYDKPQHRLLQTLLRGRKRYYRDFWALNGVSFDVMRGETFGIIGRNGSGKSTLLQLICGTLTPSRGDIRVNGRVAALLELGAGFNPEFTGRENVYLNATVLGLSHAEIDQRFDRIAAFADIGEFIEQPVKTYSSGMFVRLAFAVIAHVDADVLVIDEALAVGDAFFTQKCMRFLREFREHGTILLVSHDLQAVMSLCDRALWLDAGQMRNVGLPKVVCEEYVSSIHGSGPVKQQIADDAAAPAGTVPGLSSEEFGRGYSRITGVELLDAEGAPLGMAREAQPVRLIARAVATHDLQSPAFGFHVKDRLGQILLGRTSAEAPALPLPPVKSGQAFSVEFHFVLPTLMAGDYVVTVAVGEGTADEYAVDHWIHDAIAFTSVAYVRTGLIGCEVIAIEQRS
jgi:lipopolysaccharide transport system ATP-binding protein